MIIYNVTTQVDHRIAEEWLVWIRNEHIPDIIATNCFTGATVLQLIEVDTTEGPTYAVQYKAESKSHYNRYIRDYAEGMRKKAFDKWGDKFISYRSVLEELD